ncbi:hypothetical protein QZH41_018535 [Actinostola sp. cb2023]|nr:hypothetical protein QZH41_018535 [Actinostola sp. cb2023]
MVAKLTAKASPQVLRYRNPQTFIAGEIHKHLPEWQAVVSQQPKGSEILSYIESGVDVLDFVVPFKGEYQGIAYHSTTPPRAEFKNSPSCCGFEEFISTTLLERLQNGSITLWDKMGEVDPPHLVMPLTIEATKPRMCHDERFLNLWIKHLPLSHDYISNLPRYIERNHFQTTMDDKSGYDHVKLSATSATYFGFEWGRWYFAFNTIPFGWKASAYLYHTIGMAATNHIRSLGVPCSQYIDDRHVGQLAPLHQFQSDSTPWSDFELAVAAAFICASVLISLGYFIGLPKSSLIPRHSVKFLGFIVDSERCAFLIPEAKKEKFAKLRESILGSRAVSITTLQRLAGKITSFTIAVPAAQLHAREIYLAVSGYTKSSRMVKVSGALRKEIEHWRFLDSWKDCLPWLSERHTVIKIFCDASNFAWGGIINAPGSAALYIRDYWPDNLRERPIVVKEALALLNTLRAGKALISNTRLDVYTDSMALLQSWKRQGGKNRQLNEILNDLASKSSFTIVNVRPRIWRPSAPCPECFYLNDDWFNFCQRCGFRREPGGSESSEPFALDMQPINRRLLELQAIKSSKSYEKQKSSLHRELLGFLASLPASKTLHSTSPKDLLKFLVWKDRAGKTKVHRLYCTEVGKSKVPCVPALLGSPRAPWIV